MRKNNNLAWVGTRTPRIRAGLLASTFATAFVLAGAAASWSQCWYPDAAPPDKISGYCDGATCLSDTDCITSNGKPVCNPGVACRKKDGTPGAGTCSDAPVDYFAYHPSTGNKCGMIDENPFHYVLCVQNPVKSNTLTGGVAAGNCNPE